jgi:hypothetical protein
MGHRRGGPFMVRSIGGIAPTATHVRAILVTLRFRNGPGLELLGTLLKRWGSPHAFLLLGHRTLLWRIAFETGSQYHRRVSRSFVRLLARGYTRHRQTRISVRAWITRTSRARTKHPNKHDYDELVTIYMHLDSTTTVGQSTTGSGSDTASDRDSGLWIFEYTGPSRRLQPVRHRRPDRAPGKAHCPYIVGTNHRPTGQRGLYSFWRNSSKLIDANATRVLIGIA